MQKPLKENLQLSKIIIASGNNHKIEEIKKAFFTKPQFKNLKITGFSQKIKAIENGKTFYDNALIKANWCHKALSQASNTEQVAVIGDDSGLVVPSLDGAPGVFSARYAGEDANDSQNNQKLIAELHKKGNFPTTAYFTTVLVFILNLGAEVITLSGKGICRGTITNQPKGEHGFGYDPYFIPENIANSNPTHLTFAEMTTAEKNKLSHRSLALVELLNKF